MVMKASRKTCFFLKVIPIYTIIQCIIYIYIKYIYAKVKSASAKLTFKGAHLCLSLIPSLPLHPTPFKHYLHTKPTDNLEHK